MMDLNMMGDSGRVQSMEVPIFCHASSDNVPRYTVNAVGRSVCLLDDSSSRTDPASPPMYHTLDEVDWKAQMMGSASMRMFFINQQRLVISTQALMEEPHVICIRVLKLETAATDSCPWEDSQYSSSMEINLGPLLEFLTDHPEYPTQQATTDNDMDLDYKSTSFRRFDTTQHMRRIVKTACFLRKEDDDSSSLREEESPVVYWDVVFVDNKGSILTIQLRYDHASVQLRPLVDTSTFSENPSSIRFISRFVVSQPTYFPSTTKRSARSVSFASEGATLVSSQVDFLDSHRVLLAMSPGILCVNTITGMVASWSESQCILGGSDSPTILTFRLPNAVEDTITPTASDSSRNEDLNSITFTLGRTVTAESTRKKRQSISSIFKNATGLLQGKSVVDMFMDQQKELQTVRKKYRARQQQEAFPDMDQDSEDPMVISSSHENTSVYDAFLEVDDGGGEASHMAAVCAVTVVRINPPRDPSSSSDLYDCDCGPVKAVFTLHADGTIRMWTMPDEVMIGDRTNDIIYPWTMKVLYDSNFVAHESQNIPLLPIPPPHTWSSSFDSVSLTCKLFHGTDEKVHDTEPSNLLGSLLKTPKKRLRLETHDDDSKRLRFALIVSIRSINVDLGADLTSLDDRNRTTEMSDDYCSFGYSSPCNLTLFRGNLLDSATDQHSSHILVDRLRVPREAQSLAAMAFYTPSHHVLKDRGTFHVLYNCLGVLQVSGFGASTKSISSSAIKPTILATYDGDSLNTFHVGRVNTLDDLAFSERDDFIVQSIALRDSGIMDILMDKEGKGTTPSSMDDDVGSTVRFIESFYMKRLFRTCWGRSLGGAFISEGSIRRALLQVCPQFRLADTSPSNLGRSHSLEIHTLTAMREWASYQEAKYSAEGTTRKRNENENESNSSSTMQYSSFHTAISPKSLLNTLEATTIQELKTAQRKPGEKRRIFVGHHSRWMKLLLSVWNEEAKSRQALVFVSFYSPEDKANVLLLRTGATSCISAQANSPSRFELLDQLSLLSYDGDYDTRLRMASQEIRVQHLISTASLAVSSGQDSYEKLLDDLSAVGAINDPVLRSKLDSLIGSLSDDDIRSWLCSMPSLSESDNSILLDDKPNGQRRCLLPCCTILVRKFIDNMKKLSLSRLMILLRRAEGNENPELRQIGLRIHLTVSALKWTSDQITDSSLRGTATVLDFAMAHFSTRMKLSSISCYDIVQRLSYEYIIHSEVLSTLETNLMWTVPINLKDRFKYVLRLVSPLVSYPLHITFSQRNKFRELAATCVLNEIGCSPQDDENTSILETASSLLKWDFPMQSLSDDYGNDQFLEAIQHGPPVQGQNPQISEDALTEYLKSLLTTLFDKNMQLNAIILSDMLTFRSLLLPWIIASFNSRTEPLDLIADALNVYVSDPISSLRGLSSKLLEIASLIHRTEVLQTLCSNQSTILSAISDCLFAIQDSFPASFYEQNMVEYSKLWSSACHHATRDRQWKRALDAIMANPRKEIKISEFRTLVLTMVGGGEMYHFLDFMPFQDDAIDLCELASDTLADAAYKESCNDMSSFLVPHANHSGCLFALHACQEKWSRCAEAMDYFGLIRVNVLQHNQVQESKHFERKVMDDLTLSAVSSLQLSQLIGNPSNGEGSNLLIGGLAAEDSNTKSDIRPSLWQKNKELSSQASKVMAVRLIFIDSLSTATASELMSTPLAHIMMHLAQLGYMSHYIAMAEIKVKSPSGSRPRGRELLADAMTYLIHEFLAPASLRSSCVANGDIMMNNLPLISSRPSPSQVFQSSTRGQVIIPDVWRSHEQIVKLSRADGAMELIRSYTERYSSPSNDLAIEVANSLLELDVGQAALPSWLESLLLGPPKSRGLFAGKTGNPSALILVYIRWGMLLEAASVVTSTLLGNGFDRKKVAASRLPEKGNIDFVPYKIIDLLWDLMGKEIANPNIDSNTRKNLHLARIRIEQALTEHFELMKISEAGLHSARVMLMM